MNGFNIGKWINDFQHLNISTVTLEIQFSYIGSDLSYEYVETQQGAKHTFQNRSRWMEFGNKMKDIPYNQLTQNLKKDK